MRDKGSDGDKPDKMRILMVIGGSAVGVLVMVAVFYCCCCKAADCCNCCARKAANKYMPGMKVDEDGKTEFYEITEEEKAALGDLHGEF